MDRSNRQEMFGVMDLPQCYSCKSYKPKPLDAMIRLRNDDPESFNCKVYDRTPFEYFTNKAPCPMLKLKK
jgi:hypothetical protein